MINNIEIMKKIFIGKTDFYWEYKPGSNPYVVKNSKKENIPLNDEDIKDHLDGKKILGISPFTSDDTVKWGLIDIDAHLDADNLIEEEKQAIYDKNKEECKKLYEQLTYMGFTCIVDTCDQQGWHIYILQNNANAAKVRYFIRNIQKDIIGETRHEEFPKQDKLSDTPQEYGNQVKLHLSLHPKKLKRVTVFDFENDKQLSVEESLNHLRTINYNKIQNIEYDIENDEEYLKKLNLKFSGDIKLNKMFQPECCKFIEEIACKKALPSAGSKPRNHWLDPNINLYTMKEDKKEFREKYLSTQKKSEASLINWKTHQFNCAQIQKFLQEHPDNEVCKIGLEKCKNCKDPYNSIPFKKAKSDLLKNNLQEKEKEEILNLIKDITESNKNEYMIKIFMLIRNMDILTIESFLKKIKDKTDLTVSILRKAFNEYKKAESNGCALLRDELGYIFQTYDDDGNPIELAEFTDIKKEKWNIYNIKNNSKFSQLKYVFKYKGKEEYGEDACDIKNTLSKALRSPKYLTTINRDIERYFINKLSYFPEEEKNLTNSNGFYNDVYNDYPNSFGYYLKKETFGALQKNSYIITATSEEYKSFINLKPDINIVNKCIKIINNDLASSEKEKQLHKTIFSFSISSTLKFVLMKNKVDLHPIMVALGIAGTGKSTACRILSSKLWNKTEIGTQDWKGVGGNRLKKLNNDLFPIYTDELKEIKNLIDELKKAATSFGMDIVRGNKNQDVMEYTLYSNHLISTNEYSALDDAFKERHIPIVFDIPKKPSNSEEINKKIQYLEQNIKHLGKYIYNSYKSIDFTSEIIKIREATGKMTSREKDKIIYIKLGEKILNDLNILKDVEIPRELILQENIEGMTDLKTEVYKIVENILNNVQYLDKERDYISLKKILECKKIDENGFEYLRNKGIYITTSYKNIILGREILPEINKQLQFKNIPQNIKDIKSLKIKLNINNEKRYKQFNCLNGKIGKHTCKTGLSICTADNFINDKIDVKEEKEIKITDKAFNLFTDENIIN